MTLSDLTRCAMCDTPDTCGRAGRCTFNAAAAMDELIASDAHIIAAQPDGCCNEPRLCNRLGCPHQRVTAAAEMEGAPAPPLPPRARILREAEGLICGDRAETHGDAHRNFAHIAGVWSARLGVTVTPSQVCIMLADLKTARAWNNPEHEDNWVDGCGYLALGAEVQP